MLAVLELDSPRRRPPYGIYAYTGREWDPEIGLYYYRARYYDPKVGRFISEDPIYIFAVAHRYSYTHGNPVGLRDPDGLWPALPGYWAAVTVLGCIWASWKYWEERASSDRRTGWRYAHCMASCWSKNCGMGHFGAKTAGWFNEVKQVVVSHFDPTDDRKSPWADRDFRDNEWGYTTPDGVCCKESCKGYYGKNKTREQYGPFYWGPE